MRLTDLQPHWIELNGWASPKPFYIGVSFLCPHCVEKGACPTCGQLKAKAKRLAVYFEPPIDPEHVAEAFAVPVPPNPKAHRRENGETFETLTLSPSIGFQEIEHWHGHLRNGEITS